MDKGSIHIYCGEGKGKTTAAIGQGIQEASQGEKRYHYTVHEGKKCRSNWFCAASGAGD